MHEKNRIRKQTLLEDDRHNQEKFDSGTSPSWLQLQGMQHPVMEVMRNVSSQEMVLIASQDLMFSSSYLTEYKMIPIEVSLFKKRVKKSTDNYLPQP